MMDHNTSQSGWHTCSPRPQKEAILDEIVVAAKEKVWSFRTVWKSVAEVLWGLGASPAIVGYSSVPLHEEGYIKEEDEAEKALRQAMENEKRSVSGDSKKNELPEKISLLDEEDDEDPVVPHSFAESLRKEPIEKKSLVKRSSRKDDSDSEE